MNTHYVCNFSKFWSILKVLSLLDSTINLQLDTSYISHCAISMSLRYFAKLLLQTYMTTVSMGMSKLGKTMIFINPGMKINGADYCDVLLTHQLLPACANSLASSSIFKHVRHQPSGMGDIRFHLTRPVHPWPGWLTVILQCYDAVGWVAWPVISSPKWPMMCRVGR